MTSKSGIVPPIAPNNKALFPIFLPSAISPQAAPNTICVNESMRANVIKNFICITIGKIVTLQNQIKNYSYARPREHFRNKNSRSKKEVRITLETYSLFTPV